MIDDPEGAPRPPHRRELLGAGGAAAGLIGLAAAGLSSPASAQPPPRRRMGQGSSVLTVDPTNGDFETIKSACDFAAANDPPVGRFLQAGLGDNYIPVVGYWTVVVMPGQYLEREPFTISTLTDVVAAAPTEHRRVVGARPDIIMFNTTGPGITMEGGSSLVNFTVLSNNNTITGDMTLIRVLPDNNTYAVIEGCMIRPDMTGTGFLRTAVEFDGGGSNQWLWIQNCQIFCNFTGVGTDGRGIFVTGTGNVYARRCEVDNNNTSGGIGVLVDGAVATLDHVNFDGNWPTPISAINSADVLVYGLQRSTASTKDGSSLLRVQHPTVPSSSSSDGYEGLITIGGGFIYWHDGTDWLRVAGATF